MKTWFPVPGSVRSLVAVLLSLSTRADGSSYTIDWHKIQGGGGTSTNAAYQITGTIGQPDASGVAAGGGYILAGGYVEAIAPVLNTYTAGAGGAISGLGSQSVNYGFSGNPVTAVPSPGYYFVSWSDGVTTPTRTDLNETSTLSVTAIFAFNADVPLLAPWQMAGLAAAILGFGSRRATSQRTLVCTTSGTI